METGRPGYKSIMSSISGLDISLKMFYHEVHI